MRTKAPTRRTRHERCLCVVAMSVWSPSRRVARAAALVALAVLAILIVVASSASVMTLPTTAAAQTCAPEATCPPGDQASATSPPDEATPAAAVLLFFWGRGCPHCDAAKPFVDGLEREVPRLRVERVEVRHDPEGRRRFIETMKHLGASAAGVPTFVVGDSYVVGYKAGETDGQVRSLVRAALRPPTAGAAAPRTIDIPLLGKIDPMAVSLPALTLTMGLVDGVNPCAMWVLIVLLGILLHVKRRSRMVLYAGVFVLMSGVVYFAFMTAWSALFELVGLSRVATMILGGMLLVMGVLNLKEVVWFKRGPSLVIPDRAKPGLFRRMRAIAGAANLWIAVGGIAALAFVVNLIELGCTIGLPAVYTRILSLRAVAPGTRYAYLALYNVAYVVPLVAIVVAFLVLRRRLTLTERVAKVLKGVSGAVLTVFGLLFLTVPELLTSA